MKTSIKTFVCALALVATAFTANASDKEIKKSVGFGTGIFASKDGKINVLVEKEDVNASTTILLKNAKGEVFYRETVSKNNQKFGRILNIDALEQGKYEIEVTSKGKTQSKSFELSAPSTERVIAVK